MRKFLAIVTVALVFGGAMTAAATTTMAEDAAPKSVALTPADRNNEDWWKKRFEEKNEQLKKGDAEILLIGDSITHGWDNQKGAWAEAFGDWKVVNLGFSGDRTEHVLWRLEHGPMDAVKPKAIMLMIGTNNIGHGSSTPKDAADGIEAIVGKLRKLYPEAKILVLNVFPRGEKKDDPMRQKVDEINSYLPKKLKDVKNVTLLDINAGFLTDDGTLPKDVMPDFLHPQTGGYKTWGAKVRPVLKRMLEK